MERINTFLCVTFNLLKFSGMSRLVDVECEASEVKQKQKQQILLCEVCNIQLNSSTQAQIHYNGKTHQRRIRQANRAKSSGGARNSTGKNIHSALYF